MARVASLAPHKERAVRQMRRTAAMLDADHPETVAGDHLRDAARTLERGQLDGAKRHLDAAMEVLTPRNLIRHGITDDEGHATAKHHMHQVHRHRLAVQDIEDTQGRNDRLRAMARAARGQPEPREPFAPAEPVAAANRHAKVIQLVGPHGYTHGWVYHGAQGSAGHYDAVLGHASLNRIDRQSYASITSHINRAKGAAASGDHTTAEMHLTDARRKATRLGEPDLAQAIGTLKNYHHRQAAEAIGVKPNITQGQYDRFIRQEQARPRPKPRVIPRPYQPKFELANIDLVGPKGYVHGWIKVEDAAPFSGRVVHGKAAGGGTVNGVYNHATKTIQPRHTKPVPVTHVMRSSEPVPEARMRLSHLAKYRAAFGYGLSNRTTELSARTPMLERTPAPRGRPGGPGLYDVSGMGHTPYLQQVVKALIEKRGMPPGKAYAIARAAIRKWGARSKHPEVKSAAIRAEAGELQRQARAKASHGHANEWDVADALIELATTIDLFNPYHAPTGQFTTASGAGAGQGKASKAQQRQKLHRQIASLRSRIAGLEAQLRSSRSSSHRSKSSTPAKKGAGAQSAKQAKQGKTASGKARSTAARKPARSPSAIRAQIAILRGQLRADEAKLKALK